MSFVLTYYIFDQIFFQKFNIRDINIDFAQEDSEASLVAYFQWLNIVVVAYLCQNPFRLVVHML